MTDPDPIKAQALALAHDDAIREMLGIVCEMTGMGFAAVARVTSTRWIACQVLDKIEFGMEPGGELEIQKTICQEVRDSGSGVFIDHVGGDDHWRTHPVPTIYGFESYISVPIVLDDGSFFGTLCAIDPHEREVSSHEVVSTMEGFAARIATLIGATSDAD
jgi:GAF domain-containing protein